MRFITPKGVTTVTTPKRVRLCKIEKIVKQEQEQENTKM